MKKIAIFVLLFAALFGGTAQAGVIFSYQATSAVRSADVFGYIGFKDGVSAAIGDTWQLSDVESFSLNHGALSFSSASAAGFLQDGPGEFSADNPFANFDVISNPVQFGSDVVQTSFVVVNKTTSAIFSNNTNFAPFSDLVAITWTRSDTVVPEPSTLLLVGLALAGVVAGRHRNQAS